MRINYIYKRVELYPTVVRPDEAEDLLYAGSAYGNWFQLMQTSRLSLSDTVGQRNRLKRKLEGPLPIESGPLADERHSVHITLEDNGEDQRVGIEDRDD